MQNVVEGTLIVIVGDTELAVVMVMVLLVTAGGRAQFAELFKVHFT